MKIRFIILHWLALKALKLSSWLSVLCRAESVSTAVSLHDRSVAVDRAKRLARRLER